MQSPHLWFDEIKRTLIAYGLVQSKHDEALFFDTKRSLYVTLYVDDIKGFAPDGGTIDHLSQHLKTKYEMTDQDVQWYLGMEISRVNDSIILTQAKYVRDLLTRHGMEECSSVPTSMVEIKLKKPPPCVWQKGAKRISDFAG